VLPPLGVVSSLNISDRFHPSVKSKIFSRHFQFVSHRRSRISISKESSEARSSLLLRKELNLTLARRDFLDILDRSPLWAAASRITPSCHTPYPSQSISSTR
jgi:hypothetical protein